MANAITPEEYDTWLPFAVAYERIAKAIGYDAARDELRTRLAHDDLRAAARRVSQPVQNGKLEVFEFVNVVAAMWVEVVTDYDNVWRTGTHTFTVDFGNYQTANLTCTGIRLEPDGLARIFADVGVVDPTPTVVTAHPPLATQPNRSALSRAEAERFAAAVIHGWPQASQDWAHDKLLLFYPEQHMSRDRFRAIFRAIQGAKKPGKAPKTDD